MNFVSSPHLNRREEFALRLIKNDTAIFIYSFHKVKINVKNIYKFPLIFWFHPSKSKRTLSRWIEF